MVRIGILEDDIRSAALLKENIDCFSKQEKVDFSVVTFHEANALLDAEEEWNDVEVADRGNDILETCKMVFDYKD